MSDQPPNHLPEPYEPHPHNLIRDRKRMRSQYGPYSYLRGVSVHGAKTPLKPRNIRIRSTIPIVFALFFLGAGVYMVMNGLDTAGTFGMFGAAAAFLLLSWVGFRTARLREKWEKEHPDLAQNVEY